MVEVDHRQRAVDKAGAKWRAAATSASDGLWLLEGRSRSNPVTLFRSLQLGASVRMAERKAEKSEDRAGDFFDLLTRHDESEVVSRFYGGVQERAGVHGMDDVSASIAFIRNASPASLCEIYEGPLWNQQPPAARAIVEIALAITESQKKKKGKREITLAQGITDTKIVQDIYSLLGLEEHIGKIPAMSAFKGGYLRTQNDRSVRQRNFGEHGLDLFFVICGSRTRSAADPLEPHLIPSKIKLDIRARKKAA